MVRYVVKEKNVQTAKKMKKYRLWMAFGGN